MKALQEAIIASQNSDNDQTASFGRSEFDKMWGNYDASHPRVSMRLISNTSQCIIESPCYLGASGLQVYLTDPDVKFVLTERTPESFAKSVAGSLGTYNHKLCSFPLSVIKYFDIFLWELSKLFQLMTFRWSDGLIDPSDPMFEETLMKNYIE